MRILPILCLFTLLLSTRASAQIIMTPELREQQLDYARDSAAWDHDMFAGDLESIQFYDDVGPITPGVFPVPDYDLLSRGKYDGLFSGGSTFSPIDVAGKQVVHQTFGAGANPFQLPHMGGDREQVFFTLITVTDTIDAENYTTATSLISSRNHPDVTGEGFIKNSVSQVEFATFWTAENDRFALVNLRLFDLDNGHVIVIAPMKDGSFRSLQIKETPRGKEATETLVRQDILRRPDVIRFLTQDGIID